MEFSEMLKGANIQHSSEDYLTDYVTDYDTSLGYKTSNMFSDIKHFNVDGRDIVLPLYLVNLFKIEVGYDITEEILYPYILMGIPESTVKESSLSDVDLSREALFSMMNEMETRIHERI